jgi:hypothetical protein
MVAMSPADPAQNDNQRNEAPQHDAARSGGPRGDAIGVLIDAVDWSGLFHAYGVALDTPGHLRVLAAVNSRGMNAGVPGSAPGPGSDPAPGLGLGLGLDRGPAPGGMPPDEPSPADTAIETALEHLSSAIVHQGSLYPATGPVARIVAEIAAAPQRGLPPGARAALHDFLAEVGLAGQLRDVDAARRSAYPVDSWLLDDWLADYLAADDEQQVALWAERQEAGDLHLVRAAVTCYDLLPELYPAVTACLADPSALVRAAAAAAAASIAAHPALAGVRAGLAAALTEAAGLAEPAERTAMVLAIGDVGGDPRDFLADRNPGVRIAAALAPVFDEDETATGLLIDALRDPVALDNAVRGVHTRFWGEPHYTVADTVCRRVSDFSRLLPAALAALALMYWRFPDPDVAPYLAAAFPDGWPGPRRATGAQRAYAGALAESSAFWHPRGGNRVVLLRSLALPEDRETWRLFARTEPPTGG